MALHPPLHPPLRTALLTAALWPALAATLAACSLPGTPAPDPAGPARAESATAGTLAFPGAEGQGRFALGGRGGRVIAVTQLGDSGPGSLRDAIEASGPRTVVFRVSGTIALRSPLNVTQGRLTVAGQTAPGDGITLRNQGFSINADDVVIRFIRSRLGDEMRVDDDALNVGSGSRIIIDHVSTSWSTDETLSVSAAFDSPAHRYQDVTVQWSFITESLNCNAGKNIHGKTGICHGFGSLLRGGQGSRVSLHHNLWAHHRDRMPRPGNYSPGDKDPAGGFWDIRNNVFYNWGAQRAGYNLDKSGERASYAFVNNAYLTGPDSQGALAFEESNRAARAWFAGNTMDGRLPADPWSLVQAHPQHLPDGLPAGYRLAQPLAMAPVRTEPAAQAQARVLALGGAALVRDAHDQRYVDDVRLRRGRLIDSQTEVGGWPALRSLPAPADSDGDGLPDAWERAHGLDPQDPADGARLRPGTEYTWLEHYLNGLVAHLMP